MSASSVDDDVASCDDDDVLDNGETGTLTVTITNTGVTKLAAATVKVSTTNAHSRSRGRRRSRSRRRSCSPTPRSRSRSRSAARPSSRVRPQDRARRAEHRGAPRARRSTTTNFDGNYDWVPASSATDSNDAPDDAVDRDQRPDAHGRSTTTARASRRRHVRSAVVRRRHRTASRTSADLAAADGRKRRASASPSSTTTASSRRSTMPAITIDGGVLEAQHRRRRDLDGHRRAASASGYTGLRCSATRQDPSRSGPRWRSRRERRLSGGHRHDRQPGHDVRQPTTCRSASGSATMRQRLRRPAGSSTTSRSPGSTTRRSPRARAQFVDLRAPVANTGPAQTVNEAGTVTSTAAPARRAAGKTSDYLGRRLGPDGDAVGRDGLQLTFTAP